MNRRRALCLAGVVLAYLAMLALPIVLLFNPGLPPLLVVGLAFLAIDAALVAGLLLEYALPFGGPVLHARSSEPAAASSSTPPDEVV